MGATNLVQVALPLICQDRVVHGSDAHYVISSRGGCKRLHFNSERKLHSNENPIGTEIMSEWKSYRNGNHVGMEIISERKSCQVQEKRLADASNFEYASGPVDQILLLCAN